MFHRKLLSVLAYIVAVLLIIKAVLAIVMFVWMYFGMPPVPMFPPEVDPVIGYMLLVQELGTIIFFYLVVAALKGLVTCSCNIDLAGAAKKAVAPAVKTVRRVARRTRRKTAKK